jgi:hypothetical protein
MGLSDNSTFSLRAEKTENDIGGTGAGWETGGLLIGQIECFIEMPHTQKSIWQF